MAIAPSITSNLQFAIEFGESSVWQDSARTTSATTSDPVGAIDDQSGNGYHATQTTTSFKAVVGTESWEFDGTDDYLIIDDLAQFVDDKQDFTMYLAVDLSGSYASTYHTIVSAGITTADSPSWTCYNYGGSDEWRTHLRTSLASNRWGSATVAVPTGKQVVIIQGNSTGISIWQDGVQCSESTFDAGTMGLTVMSIAVQRRQAASETREMEMNLYGAYLYSTAHSTTDMATITSDLETMLGIGSGTQTVNADAVSMTYTVNDPTISTGAVTVSPDTVAMTFTVNDVANINTTVTESPDTVGMTYTVNDVDSVSATVTTSPDIVAMTYTANDPTITTGTVTVNADAVAMTYTVNDAASVTAGGSTQTVNADAVAMSYTVNDVDSIVTTVTESPDTVGMTYTVNDVASISAAVTVSPDTVGMSCAVNDVDVSTGAVTVSPDVVGMTFTVNDADSVSLAGTWTATIQLATEWTGSNALATEWTGSNALATEWTGSNTLATEWTASATNAPEWTIEKG